ncbi:alpha/beta hydrolase [Spirosoma sp. BT702]|uniref:Alpha/beta hydrolase n=1 Tax=Spirosoma profusum TaxID=2771354 RepID=A0A927AUY0_9BACT|nr:alpha/beta hydrolase [Spirosoma profusum]MBD2704885.1 alpha/beta hydrolase [Spirosoma profusum]
MVLSRLLWLAPLTLILLTTLLVIANEYAVASGSKRTKDILYDSSDSASERHRLDVYTPRSTTSKTRPVVVFIHGGSWDSGSKNMYSFVGRRLASQGVVAVLINYRLAPAVEVPEMAVDCSHALVWTYRHIAEYGGDPNQIYVMGHSAGGGLAALLAVNSHYFTQLGLMQNPIKGAILDDPAGLDMFDYLKKMEYPGDEKYLIPFGKKADVWQMVSALYQVDANCPPMLMYTGEETYPSIIKSSRKFDQQLKKFGIRHTLTIIPGKKHVGMAVQLFWKNNLIYKDLRKFIGVDQ